MCETGKEVTQIHDSLLIMKMMMTILLHDFHKEYLRYYVVLRTKHFPAKINCLNFVIDTVISWVKGSKPADIYNKITSRSASLIHHVSS